MSKVYQSSRCSFGNMIFPDRVHLEQDTVRFEKRHLIGGEEESIRYEQIASVSVQRGLFFADLLFETTGGSEPVFLNGLWAGAAAKAKAELQTRIRAHSTNREDKILDLLEEQNRLLRRLVDLTEKVG